MGVVYLARQVGLKRDVAVKMILAGGHAGPDERRRFRAEAEAIARLRHPNIVQVHEVGEADGHAYFSMEYVEGGSLAGRTDSDPRAAAEVVELLARAVHHAHQGGVVHRDLKPANVLLTADGQPKVTDFGLAKRLDTASGVTPSGSILGTPGYMAPEQATGQGKRVGLAADVYALGAILYYLLTGRPPFHGDNPVDTILQVVSGTAVPPRRLRPSIPRDLDAICLKCLEKDPTRRYPSAEALADDLRQFQAGGTVSARPRGAVRRGWRWCLRYPTAAALAGALSLAAIAVLGLALLGNRLPEDAASGPRAALRTVTERDEPPPPVPAVQAPPVADPKGEVQRAQPAPALTIPGTPDVVLVHVLPPLPAGFAVRADDDPDQRPGAPVGSAPSVGLGAVAIVLDYSGSMRATDSGRDNWQAPDSKIRQALTVLKSVLGTLPRGTPVSIRIFGHKKPAVASNNPDPEVKEAEDTRATPSERVFRGRVTWSRENPAPLQGLMDKLSAYHPQWGTPLLDSMVAAKAEDFPSGFQGARTLVVLTDGADTSYPRATRVEAVSRRLKEEFADGDVSIQMILFRVDQQEEGDARNQFTGLAQLRPPGRLRVAKTVATLAADFDEALRPKLRLLDGGEPVPGVPPDGLPANRARDGLYDLRFSGPVEPRLYTAQVFNSRQRLWLDRGDRLLVRLRGGGDAVQFERGLLADEFPTATTKAVGAWRLTVLSNQSVSNRPGPALRVLAALETTDGRVPGRGGVLQQTRPAFVWWEVGPVGANPQPPGALRVCPASGYPAAAWELTLDDWPADRPGHLRVWCGTDPPPVVRRLPLDPARLADGGFRQAVEADDGRPAEVSVTHEERPLRTDPDRPESRTAPCLVVHVKYPPGQPLLARLIGFGTAGQEHRFYQAAGAYVGLFGPVPKDHPRGSGMHLELLSVRQFTGHSTAIALDLPPPRAQPQPPPLRLGSR
jgi:hypothetical protein